MKAKKQCFIVAYDISLAKRRSLVVKLLEPCGHRVNRSVFECMLSDAQLMKLKHELWKAMNPSTDSIAIYPLCLNCFCKATYLPKYEETAKVVNLFA